MNRAQQNTHEERGGTGGARSGTGSGPNGEPTSVLIRRLVSNIGALLGVYAQLGRDEGVLVAKGFMIGLGLLGAAAVVAVTIPGLVVVAAIVLLSLVVQLWAAALIVLGATVLVTGILVVLGLRRLRWRRLATVGQKIREDLSWLRNELLGKQ